MTEKQVQEIHARLSQAMKDHLTGPSLVAASDDLDALVEAIRELQQERDMLQLQIENDNTRFDTNLE